MALDINDHDGRSTAFRGHCGTIHNASTWLIPDADIQKASTMATATPPENNDNERNGSDSRLNREVREILERTEKIRPFPGPTKRTRPATARKATVAQTHRFSANGEEWVRKLIRNPLLLAVGLGLLAWLVSDTSRLLANVLAFAAIAALFSPFFLSRRGSMRPGETHLWRGQVIESTSARPSAVDSVQRWWRSRRP